MASSTVFLETPKPTPHPARRWVKRVLAAGVVTVFLFGLGVLLCNLWICGSTAHAIYDQPEDVPETDVALVLGTAKYVSRGKPNLHFTERVNAAAELYHLGAVKHLLVSGDNRTKHYNEPRDLKQSLIELGVAKEDITCDFAGLRTLDSIYRADEVFKVEQLVVISDDFHLSRALFLAQKRGIDAIGYRAASVPKSASKKSRAREWFARVKAVLDIYLLGTEPRHYGDPEPIILSEASQPTTPLSEEAPLSSPDEPLPDKVEASPPIEGALSPAEIIEPPQYEELPSPLPLTSPNEEGFENLPPPPPTLEFDPTSDPGSSDDFTL